MKTQLKLIGLTLITLLFLTFPLVGFSQPYLLLTSTNIAPANNIKLHWTWTPTKPSATYGYTLFQWDDVLGDWQSSVARNAVESFIKTDRGILLGNDTSVYGDWGNLIFQSYDYVVGWNGTNDKGKDCSLGVYYCVIEYVDSKSERVFKSTSVTLLR